MNWIIQVTGTQHSQRTIFKGYVPVIVIVNYWQHSLGCAIYPCCLSAYTQ